MKLSTWINNQVNSLNDEIAEMQEKQKTKQEELKQFRAQKKAIGRKNNKAVHEDLDEAIEKVKLSLNGYKSRISKRKTSIARLKKLNTFKLVRLKSSGEIVSIKMLDQMLNKLKAKFYEKEIKQYKDGIVLEYTNTRTKAKGKLTLNLFWVMDIPEEVDIPIFEEGEVIDQCLTR